jgi:hypothetical protein
MALNRLSEKGSWTLDALKLELKELVVEDGPIKMTGFSMPEIDHIIIGEKPAAVETGPRRLRWMQNPSCGLATSLPWVNTESFAEILSTPAFLTCSCLAMTRRG